MARQLALDLPARHAVGREDFLVSQANAAAVKLIDAWPDWPHGGAILSGPEGSGKSHLVEVWRERSGAVRIGADDLYPADVPELAEHPALAVEDCGAGLSETALLHLINEMAQRGNHLLLTARRAPSAWGVALADLQSRLNRMPIGIVDPPDDRLMEAVLVKQFADRQLDVPSSVIRYLVLRLERSFKALHEAAARLDRLAIEEQRPVTRALAARSLTQSMAEDI